MKKIIRLLILSCLVIICLIPNVAFAYVDPSPHNWDDALLTDDEFNDVLAMNPNNKIEPCASGLITSSSIAISKSGNTLIIAGYTNCSSDVSKCGFKKVTIQRRKNSSNSWSNYQTYNDLYVNGRTYRLSKKVTVSSGYQYRVTCTHYAKKNIFSTQTIDKTSNILTF